MKFFKATVFLLICMYTLQAQNIKNKTKLSVDFIEFFQGDWSGEGQFSNGKKIEADASFKLSLDSCWLIYTHTDKPPNGYKAISILGIDKVTGKFLDYVFDNFQGHRLFAAKGWEQSGLILTNTETKPATYFERFTYLKIDTNKFKIIYEVSKDSVNWKLGDSLIFTKTDR